MQDLELMRGRLEGMLELPDAREPRHAYACLCLDHLHVHPCPYPDFCVAFAAESASAEAPESGATVAVAAGGEPAAAGQADMEAMIQWEEDALDQELLSLRAQLKVGTHPY